MMKIYALEEHFATAEIMAAWQLTPPEHRDLAVDLSTGDDARRRLLDLTDRRLAYMDDAGIDVQVLSVTTTGVEGVEPSHAVSLARDANDLMARTIRAHPDRFEGFATLPVGDPSAAAEELRRAIVELGLNGAMMFGRNGDRNIDDAHFVPILEVANELRAPIYLHPQSPPRSVRAAYYDGFPHEVSTALATAGIGWHYETGIQFLRLMLSGRLDELTDLPIILGHWGEVMLFWLERVELVARQAGLPRSAADYAAAHLHVTPGGILSHRYLRWAIDVLGEDRILFATDYPFAVFPDGAARAFIDQADVGDAARAKIASGNWERLRPRIRRSS